ncbi:hypothetical protein, partial [Paenibacillus xylanexedens]|uniref:hypothetical protein n=1 Tax=Paenibacillus xylanexedens TaxID=528191 RepID=UPI00164324E4
MKDEVMGKKSEVEWYGGEVGEGGLGKLVEDVVEWKMRGEGYWGSGVKIWVCEERGEEFGPHRMAELRAGAIRDMP